VLPHKPARFNVEASARTVATRFSRCKTIHASSQKEEKQTKKLKKRKFEALLSMRYFFYGKTPSSA
jgi:hypothetical protein